MVVVVAIGADAEETTMSLKSSLSTTFTRPVLAGLAAFVVATANGCIVEGTGHSPPPTATDAPPTATPQLPASDAPQEAFTIDTGRAPRATPGDGAGVFVAYRGAGEWELAWTCDTNLAPHQACTIDLAIGGTDLTVTNALPHDAVTSAMATAVRVHTLTAATTDSVTLRGQSGSSLVVSAKFNGVAMPALVFHVTGNAVASATSDPVEYTPSVP